MKIVEGPNKGAEIALVEGVAVTLGKGDDCDIILADLTLPDAPLSIEATADGVTADGAAMELLAVRTIGATSFAVGPADAPWGELKWPKKESPETPETPDKPESPEKPEAPEKPGKPEAPEAQGRRRGCGCGCLVAVVVLLLLAAGLAWFFRDRLGDSDRLEQFERIGRGWYARFAKESRDARSSGEVRKASLSDIAEKYGLSLAESNGASRVSGNLKTRRERLAATAEAYQARPGADLDLSDDESFRAAAEDALFTVSEGALKVCAATNRFLKIVGSSPSPLTLKKALEAINSDIPKLRGVDVSGVVVGGVARSAEHDGSEDSGFSGDSGFFAKRTARRKSRKAAPSLPVCGILTTPYPCLVMRDGRRLMEGATVGDSVVAEIGADSVTLTNSTGRFTWRP